MENKLIGALIGMARATDGNEHLISVSSTAVVIASLTATEHNQMEQLLKRVAEEKRKMVPDCFSCSNPCGRTSDYDLSRLSDADTEVRDLKLRILSGLRRIASADPQIWKSAEPLLYMGLIVIGMEDYTAEDLRPIVQKIDAAVQL